MKVTNPCIFRGQLNVDIEDPKFRIKVGTRLRDEHGNMFTVTNLPFVSPRRPGICLAVLSGVDHIGDTVEIV